MGCLLVGSPAAERILVSVTASLGDAVGELAKAHEAATGDAVVCNVAASSTLAKQIEHGALAEVFISADATWMDYLTERQLIDPTTRREPLGNTLVVVAPTGKGFPLTIAKDFPAEHAFSGRMAMGDPSHVPVGIHARQAFTAVGWWGWLEPRIAAAADTRAGLRLVERGEVDCGVVFATDAQASSQVEILARIPEELHAPVRYAFAATTTAGPAGRALVRFLTGPEAMAVYRRRGFTILP